MRPTKEQTQIIDVPYTVQVPYTQLVPRTELVPRTILVPHTEIESYVDYEPIQITTVIPGGLVATSYNRMGYNNAPPIPTATEPSVSTKNVSNINFDWGGGQVLDSGLYEDVIVKFTGYINIPSNGTYTFYAPGDDGIKMYIDNNIVIDDWYDKGGGGTMVQKPMTAGQHQITLWYYENGGGANVWLYWITPDGTFEIIPASTFGEQTVTETIYQPVVKHREITVFTEETVYDEVTVFDEVTLFREETRYRQEEIIVEVPDEDATAPLIKNPELLPAVVEASRKVSLAEENLTNAAKDQADAKEDYDTSVVTQTEKASIIEVASLDVTNKQEELVVSEQELQAIPPFREPTPTPEETQKPIEEPEIPITPEIPEPNTPTPTEEPTVANVSEINPQELSEAQAEELKTEAVAILETSEQGSPEYEQALEALFVVAQADDIVVNEELAAVPVLGATVVALTDAINFMGNVGADMSPKVREESKKIVVSAVVAVGAAVNAATGAALTAAAPSAAASASAGGSGGTSSTRRKD